MKLNTPLKKTLHKQQHGYSSYKSLKFTKTMTNSCPKERKSSIQKIKLKYI